MLLGGAKDAALRIYNVLLHSRNLTPHLNIPNYMEEQTSSSPHETNTYKNIAIEYEDSAKAKGKRKVEWPERELEDDNSNCVICLDPISEKCVATPCGHSYDYVCILNWLELRQSCPLCNALVESLLVHTKDGKIHKVSRYILGGVVEYERKKGVPGN